MLEVGMSPHKVSQLRINEYHLAEKATGKNEDRQIEDEETNRQTKGGDSKKERIEGHR